ncbi:MAG: YhbY family RNA-binding protein [Ruminococcaceae bacterium]|nr:YhbY family RNA-binding protein [Oscillospiraceae bacterium]
MTSKQRAYLRKMSNQMDSIFNVGKNGISDELIIAIDDALKSRELIKIGVLDNIDISVKDIAEEISSKTSSETVIVLGRKIVLYRKNPKIGKYKV